MLSGRPQGRPREVASPELTLVGTRLSRQHRGMKLNRRSSRWCASSIVAIALAMGVSAAPAAALPTVSLTFGDWRCAASGGGSVAALQVATSGGSAPYVRGRTVRVAAIYGRNSVTGAIWCKRPFWPYLGRETPVYNLDQGIWVAYNGQSFNL